MPGSGGACLLCQQHPGGRSSLCELSVSSRSAYPVEQVPGQSGLHSEITSPNKQTNKTATATTKSINQNRGGGGREGGGGGARGEGGEEEEQEKKGEEEEEEREEREEEEEEELRLGMWFSGPELAYHVQHPCFDS